MVSTTEFLLHLQKVFQLTIFQLADISGFSYYLKKLYLWAPIDDLPQHQERDSVNH